ncbi:AP-2 complex subunit sigma [Marasmius crinis-equi]|uniref:AP-2 complex subunit sigma n=1 Tax=Marasmius crinis-equi TaxID=585013 RepID=A0ABR3F161_9AGAR
MNCRIDKARLGSRSDTSMFDVFTATLGSATRRGSSLSGAERSEVSVEFCRELQFRNYKIVYRRYAGLFFCVCVDANDNELAYLEAIHLFVEILDSFFDNVCELDLVFNFYKVEARIRRRATTLISEVSQVYAILDEIFLAGEMEETSKDVVLQRLEELEKLE